MINTQKEKIVNLIQSLKSFISNSTNKLNDTENVSIDFYYRIKEIFKRLDIFINSFDKLINNSMENDYFQIQTYVNEEIYMKDFDSLFDQIEVIWYIFIIIIY